MKKYDVIIIGAGSAGLSARKEVAKETDNYLVVDQGPLGTTCARVGCMPSKVLIQVANDFDRKHVFKEVGIGGGESLSIDSKKVMTHVRKLRDRFVKGVLESFDKWSDKFIQGTASFVDQHTIKIGEDRYEAKKIIVAVGSRPRILKDWEKYKDHLVTTDDFFEMEELPQNMAVIGLGVIGLELGQALNKLGVDIVGLTKDRSMGGLSEPHLQDYVIDKLSKEFPIHFDGAEFNQVLSNNRVELQSGDKKYEVDKVLVCMGRKSNLDKVNFSDLNIPLNDQGIPEIDENQMTVKDHPHLFIAGDATATRPILHEASDEGTIAGYHAVHEEACFKRRVPFAITFSEPNIAQIGERFKDLKKEGVNFVTGKVSFEGQGRSIVKLKEQGILHIYVDKESGRLLGAELQAPDGEHLAHLIAWAISLKLTAKEALKMPFYHPVVEEGLRTALRDAVDQSSKEKDQELSRCGDTPIR